MVEVLSSGFFTSVQDLGRFEHQDYGVPIGGAMDIYSAKIANAIVGNNDSDAVLEITMTGPTLKFHHSTAIALSGADISPQINSTKVLINTPINIAKGDVLSFNRMQYGFRAYLAVSGGFQTPTLLGSRSYYKPITERFKVERHDHLDILSINHPISPSFASVKINNSHFEDNGIEVFKGPEFDQLSTDQLDQLVSQKFCIAKENSRMAYQLEELIHNTLDPIITSLVLPGTVQLTPSGQLIVLMRDCQTTGGYPRILQLKDSAINKLSQKFTGQQIEFKLTE